MLARIAKVCLSNHLKGVLIIFGMFLFFSPLGFSQSSNSLSIYDTDFVSTSLSEEDVLETISTFKTNNPSLFANLFKKKMPPHVKDKKLIQEVLNDIPKLVNKNRIEDKSLEFKVRKILLPILSFYNRENIYQIIIFKYRIPFVSLDTGTLLFISTGFLIEAESVDTLLGAVAHEIGHEYFTQYSIYTKHLFRLVKSNGNEQALEKKFINVLKILELQCDAFAVITLAHLKFNPFSFIEDLEKMMKRYPEDPKGFHPKIGIRKRVVKGILPITLKSSRKPKIFDLFEEIKQKLQTE